MDELPRDARAFLNLTRDAHDPPDSPAARQRVHARLMAALAAPPALDALGPGRAAASGAAGTTHGIFGWASSTKLALAATIIALSSGAFWVLSTQHAPAPSNPGAQTLQVAKLAPVPSIVPAPAPEAQTQIPSTSAPARTAVAPKRTASSNARVTSPSSLAAETALLMRASSQLSHDDVAGALRSIEQHRRQFGRATQLTEEREGLEALAHCQGQRASARAEAKRYVERVPTSVLVTRLELACGL